jgi:hypothetical protein
MRIARTSRDLLPAAQAFCPAMKRILFSLALLLSLATAPLARADDVEDFLKRATVGDFTLEDFHPNYTAVVFLENEILSIDRAKAGEMLEEMKKAGAKLTLDEFKVVSKTETPLPAGKGTMITVVTHTKTTLKSADGETKYHFVNHDVLLRNPDGKIVYVSGAESVE